MPIVPIKPLMDTSTGVTRDQDTIRGRTHPR
jgi:hypothetical protein